MRVKNSLFIATCKTLNSLKQIGTLLLSLAGICLLHTTCGNSDGKSGEILARTPVSVTRVVRKSISETLEFPAVSFYIRKNIIRSPVTGTIETVSASLGDFVRKDQLLFIIKTREASAIKGNNLSDTSLVFKGLIKILSPGDGALVSISHQNTDYIQEGDELAVLADQGSLVFKLEVPFEFRRYIELNGMCYLRLPDSIMIKGYIEGQMPEMDTQSQTISYFVRPMTTEHLPQNLIAQAVLNKRSGENVQVLPRNALLSNENQTEFWIMKVINDSTAVKVPVRKGIENYDEVEIMDPVFLPEERILLTGNYGLTDTAAIIIIQ